MKKLDLKSLSVEELNDIKNAIDKLLFERGEVYNKALPVVGDIYIRDNRFIYVIKDVTPEFVHTDVYSICKNSITKNTNISFMTEMFKTNAVSKLSVSEKELKRWYQELTEKINFIDSSAEKEKNSLIDLYIKELITKK